MLILYLSHYFQHNPQRLCVMTLASHQFEHLPDDILNAGPPTALWEFVTERSMGEVARSVTSRLYPFSQLANTLMQCEQLKVMCMKYLDMSDYLTYSEPTRNWNTLSCAEVEFPHISKCILYGLADIYIKYY